MRMLKIKKMSASITVLLSAIFLSLMFICYWQKDTRPMIGCFRTNFSTRNPKQYCVLNPFRNKSTEITAEKILQELKNSQTDVVLPYIQFLGKDYDRPLVNKENLVVLSWQIQNIEVDGNNSRLIYFVNKAVQNNNYWGETEPMIFYFVQTGNSWELQHIQANY